MKKVVVLVILGLLLGTVESLAEADEKETAKPVAKANPVVLMETSQGTMEIELLFNAAPLTAQNFLDLVNKKFYDGLTFHRIVPGFVIQGGDPKGDGTGGPGYTIKDEKSSQPQVRGTLGMAKSGPNTTGSQFYINLADNTFLDAKGFTGFAKVVKGIEVADKISKLSKIGETPKEKVVITKAYLKSTPPGVKSDKK